VRKVLFDRRVDHFAFCSVLFCREKEKQKSKAKNKLKPEGREMPCVEPGMKMPLKKSKLMQGACLRLLVRGL
jgi:hypothetical protein